MQLNVNQKPNGDPFEALPKELEETFREIWTNNADRLSLLYSGTGALKTDFTRTGKRSYMGALEDGKRAVTRYFINNFYDTYNQNALDLLLGKVKASDIHTIGAQSHSATSVIATSAGVSPSHAAALRPLLLVGPVPQDVRQDLQLVLLHRSHAPQPLHDLLLLDR
jgi:hypothetical protein